MSAPHLLKAWMRMGALDVELVSMQIKHDSVELSGEGYYGKCRIALKKSDSCERKSLRYCNILKHHIGQPAAEHLYLYKPLATVLRFCEKKDEVTCSLLSNNLLSKGAIYIDSKL